MKVVFVSLFKEEFGGGEGRVAHELAQYFASRHGTVMMCPGDTTGLYETESGLKIFGVRSAGEGHVYVTALSARNVRRMFHFLDEFQPDVVHAHDPASLGLIAQIWARMHDVLFVHTAHVLPSRILDFGATDVVKILRSSLTGSVARQGLSNFYQNCDAIIALNQPGAQDIREFGYDGNVFVIPNGRDLKKYGVCKNAEVSSQERVLTFIGSITERKNQRYLLEVMKHLPAHYKLQIVGEALDPAYGRRLRNLAKRRHLDNVVFTGQVVHKDIPPYLQETHVFVSASKMEVQSLVVIEALASGTPVVGLSNETIDGLVDDEVGCRLPQDADPKAFARCVENICQASQSEYDRLCENARDRVRTLDWANVISLTTEAYETLLRERPAVAPSSTEKGRARLRRTISLLPPGEVRDVLMQQLAVLERIQQEIDPKSRLRLASKIKRARRVPSSSWVYAGLTVSISVIGYLFLRYVTSLFGMRKSRDA